MKNKDINYFCIYLLLATCFSWVACEWDFHETPADPIAAFEVFNENCSAPCEVLFRNNSTHAFESFWKFGDGNTSNNFAPRHTYAEKGIYEVRLTVGNGTKSDITTQNIRISTPGTWTVRRDFAGAARHSATGFVIGRSIYVGTGQNELGKALDDFWEYNTSLNVWIQRADFEGRARYGAVGFSVNGKGYIATGQSNSQTFLQDVWEYNPVNNTWLQKNDFPGGSRTEAVATAIGGRAYLGTGKYATPPYEIYLDDWWEYNSNMDGWEQKQSLGTQPSNVDFGIEARAESTIFVIGENIFVISGKRHNSQLGDLWRYNVNTDFWSILFASSFSAQSQPEHHSQAIGFNMNGKGYVTTGFSSFRNPNIARNLWEFDPTNPSWVERALPSETLQLHRGVGFSVDGKAYVGIGSKNEENTELTNAFWQYELK